LLAPSREGMTRQIYPTCFIDR